MATSASPASAMAHVSLTAGRRRDPQADARAQLVTAARHDLVAALRLRDQKVERRILAAVRVREACATADAAGVGRRQSPTVRAAEEEHAHAQRDLDLATHDVACALVELVARVLPPLSTPVPDARSHS